MKKFVVPVLLIVILIGGLFVLTGCGDNKTETQETKTNANTETNNTNAQIQAVDFKIQNLVPNTTVKSICATVTGADTWTPNLLGELELATGTQAGIGLGITEATSSWDFKITDTEGTEVTITSVDLSSILANKGGVVALQINENNELVLVVK